MEGGPTAPIGVWEVEVKRKKKKKKNEKNASLYLLDVNCQVCFQLNKKKKKPRYTYRSQVRWNKLIVRSIIIHISVNYRKKSYDYRGLRGVWEMQLYVWKFTRERSALSSESLYYILVIKAWKRKTTSDFRRWSRCPHPTRSNCNSFPVEKSSSLLDVQISTRLVERARRHGTAVLKIEARLASCNLFLLNRNVTFIINGRTTAESASSDRCIYNWLFSYKCSIAVSKIVPKGSSQ